MLQRKLTETNMKSTIFSDQRPPAFPAAFIVLLTALMAAGALSADEPKLKVIQPDSSEKVICTFGGSDYIKVEDNDVLAFCEPELEEFSGAASATVLLPQSTSVSNPVMVSWNSSGPEGYSCVSTIESGPASGLSNWTDGGSVAKKGEKTITPTIAGQYELGVICTAGNQPGSYETATLSVTEADPGDTPSGLYIDLTPSSPVEVGNNVTITWGSHDATSCTASSSPTLVGWNSGLSNTSGSKQISSPAINNYTLTLSCENSAGTTTTSETLRVVEEQGNGGEDEIVPACEDRERLEDRGFTRRINFLSAGGGRDFAQIWQEWPGSSSHPKNVELEKNEYVSLEFNSGPFPGINRRNMMYNDAPVGGVPGNRNGFGLPIYVISRCKGDFDIEKIKQDPATQGMCSTGGSGTLKVTMTEDKPFECRIQENTTYYLNITTVYGDEHYGVNGPPNIDAIQWGCANSEHTSCGALMKPGGNWPNDL